MSIDYDALTSEIMDSKPENGLVGNILKTEIGDSILGRFLIHKINPKDSLHNYNHHGWKTSGGKYVSYLCPTTRGEKCPICSRSIQMWQGTDPFLKEKSKKIRRKQNTIAKFYVIENTKNPSMNGKVKLFRFGKQINDVLNEATKGEDKEIFGKNIWRLDEKGCNFRINVKPNSDKKDAWPSYTSSKFLPPSDLGLSDDEVMELLDNPLDHTKIFDEQLSYEQLVAELQTNFIDDLQHDESDEEDFTFGMKKTETVTPKKVDEKISKSTDDSGSSEIDDLLGELDAEVEPEAKKETKSAVDSEMDDLLSELD